MHVEMHTFRHVYIGIYFGLSLFDKPQRLSTVACSSAMIAMIAIVLLAIAPNAHGAHAFGHQIAVELSQECPLWPCQFFDAAAETMMLRVYNSG